MASSKQPCWIGPYALNAVTVRKVRTGEGKKTAHLFVKFTNGATNGHAVSCCGILQKPGTRNEYKNWSEAAPGVPLCNHCGRGFHKDRKSWIGLP